MRKYELMYIIKPNLDEEATTAVIDKFKGIIENNGGQIVDTDVWGKRRLAYEINDIFEGFYVLVHFNAEPAVVAETERLLKIEDNVMRYIVVREEE